MIVHDYLAFPFFSPDNKWLLLMTLVRNYFSHKIMHVCYWSFSVFYLLQNPSIISFMKAGNPPWTGLLSIMGHTHTIPSHTHPEGQINKWGEHAQKSLWCSWDSNRGTSSCEATALCTHQLHLPRCIIRNLKKLKLSIEVFPPMGVPYWNKDGLTPECCFLTVLTKMVCDPGTLRSSRNVRRGS